MAFIFNCSRMSSKRRSRCQPHQLITHSTHGMTANEDVCQRSLPRFLNRARFLRKEELNISVSTCIPHTNLKAPLHTVDKHGTATASIGHSTFSYITLYGLLARSRKRRRIIVLPTREGKQRSRFEYAYLV